MRTHHDIVQHIIMLQADRMMDIFGFQASTLLAFLPFALAEPFLDQEKLMPGIDGVWDADVVPLTELHVDQEMRKYMAFALEKASNHRGLSAMRSLDKMRAWLWIRGNDALLAAIDTGALKHQNYGVPILKAICDTYTFDFPASDARMMQMSEGNRCRDTCNEGCVQ